MIDDDPEVVDLLVSYLREEGYGVLGALTIDEGIRLVSLPVPISSCSIFCYPAE